MEAYEILVILFLVSFIGLLFTGYPIAWILGGLSLIFTALSIVLNQYFGIDTFLLDRWQDFAIIVDRIFAQSDRSPQVLFPGRAYILPRAGQAGIPVQTVNAAKLDLKLVRISDRNLVRTIEQDYFARPLDTWSLEDFNATYAEQVWKGSADLAKGDDPSLINEQMVITVDGQLFYTVLKALPYLIEYPYECTEQTMNRFVSTGIVSSVYRQYPAVAKMASDRLRGVVLGERDPGLLEDLEHAPAHVGDRDVFARQRVALAIHRRHLASP